MKKNLKTMIVVIFSIIICMNKSYAQVDTSTTQKLLQYIFQPVDKSQIPTVSGRIRMPDVANGNI